jgi:hypothetical protein
MLSAERRAQLAWRASRARRHETRGDSVRVRELRLCAGERRRIVASAQRLLAAAGASPDAATRERAASLLDTVRRLAALLHRLPG